MDFRVSGGQFFIDGFPVRSAFKIDGGKRLISYISNGGAGAAEIEVAGGEAVFDKTAFEAVYWKNGIELAPPFRSAAPAKVEELSYLGQTVRVEIREGKRSSVTIWGAERTEFRLKAEIEDARVQIIKGQSAAVIDLRARADGGDYIALFSLPRGAARLLLEGAGEVETSGNDVIVKERLGDSRERLRTSRYFWQGSSFALAERAFERGAAPVFDETNAGRLLLEAVKAGDEADISSYLSPDIADAEAIERYFGSFDRIRAPLFTRSETAVAVERVLPSRTVALTFDFEFAGGKIANVIGEE